MKKILNLALLLISFNLMAASSVIEGVLVDPNWANDAVNGEANINTVITEKLLGSDAQEGADEIKSAVLNAKFRALKIKLAKVSCEKEGNLFDITDESCTALLCTANEAQADVDCTADILNASSATKTSTCNATGTGFDYGACTLVSCNSGYEVSGNTCTEIIVPADVTETMDAVHTTIPLISWDSPLGGSIVFKMNTATADVSVAGAGIYLGVNYDYKISFNTSQDLTIHQGDEANCLSAGGAFDIFEVPDGFDGYCQGNGDIYILAPSAQGLKDWLDYKIANP